MFTWYADAVNSGEPWVWLMRSTCAASACVTCNLAYKLLVRCSRHFIRLQVNRHQTTDEYLLNKRIPICSSYTTGDHSHESSLSHHDRRDRLFVGGNAWADPDVCTRGAALAPGGCARLGIQVTRNSSREPSSRDTDSKHSYHTVLLQLTQNTVRLSKLTSSVIKFWGSVRMGLGGHLTSIIIYPPCQSVLINNEYN